MKPRSVATIALVGLGLAATPAAAATTLTFASWVPWTHGVSVEIYIKWMENVEKASNGEIKFHRLPKGVGHPRAYLDAVRTGQIDAGFSTHGYSPSRFMPYRFAEFPFAGDNATVSSVALQRTHDRFLADKELYKGAKLIGVNTLGPGIIHLTNKAIRSPSDMKGLKVRTGGPIQRRIVQFMGGVPVSKPATKAYEIISTNIVDGTLLPWEAIETFKIKSLIKYSTYVPGGLYTASMFLVVNQKKYDALSPRAKAAIDRNSGETFTRLAAAGWNKLNDAGKAAAIEAGIEVVEAPKPVVDAISKLNKEFEAEYVQDAKKFGIDGRSLLGYFRGEVAKLEAAR